MLSVATLAQHSSAATELIQDHGNFRLLVDGKPFFVMGVGGDASKSLLKQIGGNAFRTWGEDGIEEKLSEAQKLGLKVAVGLRLEPQRQGHRYRDAAFVKEQFDRAQKVVSQYKDHPAVLLWGIGNEIEGYDAGDDADVWKAVNDIAVMIHSVDPRHPTMAVLSEIGGNRLAAIKQYATDVDIIGINSYGGASTLATRYRAANVGKPYLVTEFGPLGPWEVGKTDRGVAIEPTSTQKADTYRTAYEKGVLPEKDKLCLGSFAFLWGDKQETTPTWFGMLLHDGSKVAPVDVMQHAWTGRAPADRVPTIEPLNVSNSKPIVGDTITATLAAHDPEGRPLKVTWQLFTEVEQLSVGGDPETGPKEVRGAIVRSDAKSASIQLPDHAGKYRLYVVVKDPAGNAATANVPLLVVTKR